MVLKSHEVRSNDSVNYAIADRAGLLTADFAAKKAPKGKKDCQKGKICKGSCIAKTKTCLGDMNPAQLKAHKAAQAAARKVKAKAGGGGGAAVVAATANTPIVPVATPTTLPPALPVPVPTPPAPPAPPAPIAAKAKAEKVENVDVKKLTEEDGNPRSFSTNINNKQIELMATGNHSPTWAQNNDGITVSGNKSREFMRWSGGDIYSMSSGQFRSFIDKIRADKVYDKVEEFRLGSLLVSGKDLKKLSRLEAAGLISTTGTRNTRQIFINFDSKGQIRKATDAEMELAPLRAKASKLREDQSAMIEAEHSSSFSLSKADLKQIRNEETAIAKKVNEAEDKLYGRKNTKTATEAEYIDKAELWAKSQGFKNDGNDVNGFSAKQAAKHDIAHPATHDLVGLDSAGIHSYFGGLKTASGKKSLLGEEAVVNVMEHLSRGDTLEYSVMSGTRVARMLSKDSTKAERAYVRSPKFLQDLNSLAEKSLRADNFGTITKVIRESNWESGTVTQAGNV